MESHLVDRHLQDWRLLQPPLNFIKSFLLLSFPGGYSFFLARSHIGLNTFGSSGQNRVRKLATLTKCLHLLGIVGV